MMNMNDYKNMERNHFNKEWLDAGRKAGFTDEQLEFLEAWHDMASNE